MINSTLKLINGECLDLMKTIPDGSVDLVLTDPPYNIARDNNFHTMGRAGIDFGEWDKNNGTLENFIDKCKKVVSKAESDETYFNIAKERIEDAQIKLGGGV